MSFRISADIHQRIASALKRSLILFVITCSMLPVPALAGPGGGGPCLAPNPSTMTFASAPAPASVSSVSMTATTVTRTTTNCGGSLEYYFGISACTVNGGTGATDSGWQTGSTYTDSGLQANKCYGYMVQGSDSTGVGTAPVTNASSTQATTYTLANTPGAPTLSSPTATTLTLTNAENSNPSANPTTSFAVQISAPSDATWDGKWVDASGDPSASAVWLTDAQLDGLVLTGLTSSVTYSAQSKARNFNSVETSLSSSGSDDTEAADVGVVRVIRLHGGLRLRGGVRIR